MDLIHEKEELEHKVADLEAAAREWAQKFVLTTDNQKQMQSNYSSMMNNLKQQYKCKLIVASTSQTLTDWMYSLHQSRSWPTASIKCMMASNAPKMSNYWVARVVLNTFWLNFVWRWPVQRPRRTSGSNKNRPMKVCPTIGTFARVILLRSLAALFGFLNECITLSNSMVDIVVHGKATSNLIQDIDQGAVLADHCRDATVHCIDLYTNYQTRAYSLDFRPHLWSLHSCSLATTSADMEKQSEGLIRRLNALIEKTTILLPKVNHS